MPVIDAVALTQRIIVLEAAVTSGNAREAEQDRWIAELEELTTLSFEVVTLRKRPRLPEPALALHQLVRALGMHE